MIERLHAIRGGGRQNETDPELPRVRFGCDALPSAERGVSIDERVTLLAAVDELNPRERVVVLGTFGAGLPQTTLATSLGVSQSQISKILGRALDKLHRKVA